MSYYYSKTLDLTYEEALTKTTKELWKEGFGVLTEIDVKATLKEKLNVDFKKYKILGACNPPFAHRALQAEDKIGLMLPCNVIVTEISDSKTEVAVIDPIASMKAVDNKELEKVASEVREKLKNVLEKL